MKHQDLSEKFKKWIIAYQSDTYLKPHYFVWVTDLLEEKDKLILTEENKIITATSKRELLLKVQNSSGPTPDIMRTLRWIEHSLKEEFLSETVHDFRGLETKIEGLHLNKEDIGGIVNFINLFEDYEKQIGKLGKELPSRSETLTAIWDSYYEDIFFPGFFQEKTISQQDIGKMPINRSQLLVDFRIIREKFEACFAN